MASVTRPGGSVAVAGKELGFIVITLAIVIGAVWLFLKTGETASKKVSETISDAITHVPDAIYSQASALTNLVGESTSRKQEEVAPGFSSYVDGLGAMGGIVSVGTILTPVDVSKAAYEAGHDFWEDLIKAGDLERYESLDPLSKTFVTLGTMVSAPFGFSPYKAGVATKERLAQVFGW